MQQKFTSTLLIFLLTFGLFWDHHDAQENAEGATRPPDGPGVDGSAFFALRSCHQLLQSDSGEFFSPDYLCSNPPLWCNWTIQVDPEKRIHLHLEDLTPDKSCQFKQDQIHVDEPVSHLGSHKVLQKCWQEAKYTSHSNTLYVVLLIGGWPSPPYRGFYGRYQAFGPPVIYNPGEGLGKRIKELEPSPEMPDFSDFESTMNAEQTESVNPDLVYDYYDQHVAMSAGLPWESKSADGDPETCWEMTSSNSNNIYNGADSCASQPERLGDNFYLSSDNYSHVYQFMAAPTVQTSVHRTFRSGRGAAHSHSSQSDSAGPPASAQQRASQHPGDQNPGSQPSADTPMGMQSSLVEGSAAEREGKPEGKQELQRSVDTLQRAAEGKNKPEDGQASGQPLSSTEGSERRQNGQSHPHHKVVEMRSDNRGNLNTRNHSEVPHLPGDHLYEVAVEVNFSQDLEESWDNLARSLLLSVKALIIKQLDAVHKQLTLSSKRIKRLNAGALYILWLQIGQGPGGVQVHKAVHSAMQGLLTTGVNLRVNRRSAVVMSVSTADVNECGTQLVLCDTNADCVNHFGSYSCHCRPGFQDESRLGSGGTVCMDTKAAGCSLGLSAETKGVYILFFMLSSLMLMLLAVAGMLYHRHHRGAFLIRCNSSSSISSPDPNNNHLHPEDNYSSPPDADLPPPPPPARSSREAWAPVKERRSPIDLPLLRFSPLLPPDSYIDPQDAGKM